MLKKNLNILEYNTILDLYKSTLEGNNFEKIIHLLKKYRKKKIFFCGNGGSASNANHSAVDLNNIHRKGGKIKFNSYSLCANSSMITAIANDYGYDKIFKFQLEDLSEKGDILFIFSVSGSSQNLLEAARYCKKNGITIISILGFNGGRLKNISDISIIFKSKNYGMVEDLQMMLMHSICEIFK